MRRGEKVKTRLRWAMAGPDRTPKGWNLAGQNLLNMLSASLLVLFPTNPSLHQQHLANTGISDPGCIAS